MLVLGPEASKFCIVIFVTGSPSLDLDSELLAFCASIRVHAMCEIGPTGAK
jgi:hypothetical protein